MTNDEKMLQVVEIPQGVTVTVDESSIVKAVGPKGEVQKKLLTPQIKLAVKDGKVEIEALRSRKHEKKLVNTYVAHVKNLIQGANEGYIYKLKVCSGHFPMNVSVKGQELIVKNYYGESVPRKLILKQGAKVNVSGDIIEVSGCDKELVGQVSADIESLAKRTKFDRRIFQDGIYITEKNGKLI